METHYDYPTNKNVFDPETWRDFEISGEYATGEETPYINISAKKLVDDEECIFTLKCDGRGGGTYFDCFHKNNYIRKASARFHQADAVKDAKEFSKRFALIEYFINRVDVYPHEECVPLYAVNRRYCMRLLGKQVVWDKKRA